MVDGGGGIGGSWGVSRGGLVGGGGFVGRGSLVGGGSGGVLGLAGVGHISNITAVGVGNLVVDSLQSAVGKGDAVRAGGGVPVSVLSGLEVGARVVVGNRVSVGIHGGLVVFGLSIVVGGLGRSVVHRLCGGIGWGRLVGGSRGMVHGLSRSIGRGGLVGRCRGVVNRGRCSLVHWSGRGINWGRSRLVDRGGGGICRGGSMIHRGVVGGRGGLVWHSCGSVNGGHLLLITSVPMHGLGGGVGLAADGSVGRKVGLVHGMAYGGGVAQLDGLVVALVSRDSGHKKGSS